VKVVSGAVVLLAASALVAGCTDPPRPAREQALRDLVAVHDRLIVELGTTDAALSGLSLTETWCNIGGRMFVLEWTKPISLAPTPSDRLRDGERSGRSDASDQVAGHTQDALDAVLRGLDHYAVAAKDTQWRKVGGGVKADDKHMATEGSVDEYGNVKATEWFTAAWVAADLRSPCFGTGHRPGETEARDPVDGLAEARRTGTIPPASFGPRVTVDQSYVRVAAFPPPPLDAVAAVGRMLARARWSLLSGGETRAELQAYREAGATRLVDLRTTTYTFQDCPQLRMRRLVATVTATAPAWVPVPAGVRAWHAVSRAPWLAAPEPMSPVVFDPVLEPPPGPPILEGAANARGGVLLRGTPDALVVQAVGACARYETDPNLTDAWQRAVEHDAAAAAMSGLDYSFQLAISR
jgi:hypothetical protein